MQKKLIALAVAAVTSGAAFAQTNVVLSGNMDLAIASYRVQTAGTVAGTSVNTTTNTMGANGQSSTSQVILTVTEDLGKGLKAKVYIETDPNFGTSQSVTGTVTSLFSNAPNWFELSGNFGAISMGYINNFALTTANTAQPFSTALGGGYSSTFGRLDGATSNVNTGVYTVAALGGAGARDVRNNNTLQYVTPNFSGFSAGIQYAAKNDAATSPAGLFQLGLNYANGPIKVSYANSRISGSGKAVGTLQGNVSANTTPSAASIAAGAVGGTSALAATTAVNGLGTLAGQTVTHNLLGANFNMGAATIYGGYTTSRNTNNTIDSNSYNLALKYAFTGALSAMVNVLKVNDKMGTDKDRTLAGLGLDYAMSKRTTAYMRYEGGDNDRKVSTTGNFNRAAVGLRHSF